MVPVAQGIKPNRKMNNSKKSVLLNTMIENLAVSRNKIIDATKNSSGKGSVLVIAKAAVRGMINR